MRNLIEFLKSYYHWFLFVILEVASIVMLFQYNSYQGSVWISSANYVTGALNELNAEVESYFHLSKVNGELAQRNLILEQRIHKLQEQIIDKQNEQQAKDTAAYRRSQMPLLNNFKIIPAKVIDNSVNKPNNLITINKGEKDGIRKDMGVACGTGIVGIVYMTSANYSIVIPVLNTQSNISCAIEGRGYFGYLRWNGRDPSWAFVEDIPRHARFRKGDKIVTSGYSSVFPPGILVGKVETIYNSPDGLSFWIKVRLSTDFGKLRDVCVIDDNSIEERLQLLRAAQDSIKPDKDK
ncbi:MAG: rod shape-determining protein MreC [Prevotella sp.]|nr:rod shape-determining protein MreC [Prevotella sp.]